MAQIVVRNIEDDTMEGFRALAARRGVSAEQAVRTLIAEAVSVERGLEAFRKKAAAGRARLRATRGQLSDSTSLIREDRDR